jgi:hypothetical protein
MNNELEERNEKHQPVNEVTPKLFEEALSTLIENSTKKSQGSAVERTIEDLRKHFPAEVEEEIREQVRKLYVDENGYTRITLENETVLPTGDKLSSKDLIMPNGDRIALFGAGHQLQAHGKVQVFTSALGDSTITYSNGDRIKVYRDKVVSIERNGYFVLFDERDRGAAYVLNLKKE